MSDLPLDALDTPTAGRMTVTLTPNGTSRPIPRVTFSPVGMFTPGLIHDSLMHIAQEIERAQAKVRFDAAATARRRA